MHTGIKFWGLFWILLTVGCQSVPEISTPADPKPEPYLSKAAKKKWSPTSQQMFETANTALSQQDWHTADRLYQQLSQEKPNASGIWLNWGISAWQQGDLTTATQRLITATESNADNYFAYNQLGIVYREQGEWALALEAYQSAVQIWPQFAAGWYNLGILRELYFNDPVAAVAAYQQYLQLESDETVSQWIKALNSKINQ